MPSAEHSQVDRYLRLLRLDREPPGLAALGRLTLAHAARVPFENVSKLHRWKRGLGCFPTLEDHLSGMERFRFGGTCYAVNHHLHGLLRALGYRVRLCGADMREPDVHLALVVTLDEGEYLIDGGYAAPFLHPLPLGLRVPQEIACGQDRYVVLPRDGAGRTRVELHRKGALAHGYLLKPEERRIEEFERIVAESFLPGATFMNTLMLARFAPGRSLAIHGLSLVQTEGERQEVTALRDRDELVAEVERCFGIPARVTAEALAGMAEVRDPWA